MTGNDFSAVLFQNEPVKSQEENTEIPEKSSGVLDAYEAAKFWSRVEVRKRDQCWPWRYGADPAGYGMVRLGESTSCTTAHRIAYRIANGDITNGMVIRHACDNPLCCNPKHLLQGSHADNVADRVERDRSARGEGSGRAKLTEKQVIQMRASVLSNTYWASKLNVDRKTVTDAKSGKTWTHLPL